MEENEISKELKKHQEIMAKIAGAETIEKIPAVTVSTLARMIADNTKSKDLKRIAGSKFNGVATLLIEGKELDSEEVREELSRIFDEAGIEQDKVSSFVDKLMTREQIPYIVEEVKARDSKISEFRSKEHKEIMKGIEEASRISQLPAGLTPVKIAEYLSSNSRIERKGEEIPAADLRKLSALLLEGKQWDSEEIQSELSRLADD